jgi:phage gp29-like protein
MIDDRMKADELAAIVRNGEWALRRDKSLLPSQERALAELVKRATTPASVPREEPSEDTKRRVVLESRESSLLDVLNQELRENGRHDYQATFDDDLRPFIRALVDAAQTMGAKNHVSMHALEASHVATVTRKQVGDAIALELQRQFVSMRPTDFYAVADVVLDLLIGPVRVKV